jgi:hypothetical protein
VRPREPLPKGWTYAAIVIAVLAADGATGNSLGVGSLLLGLVIAVVVGLAARALYKRLDLTV